MLTHWMVRDLFDKQGRAFADCRFDDRGDLGSDAMTNSLADVSCLECQQRLASRYPCNGTWPMDWAGSERARLPGADWTFDDSEADGTEWNWRAAGMAAIAFLCLAFWFGVAWLVLP